MYEVGDVTIDSCCDAVDINTNTFYQWACPSVDDFISLSNERQKELKRRGFVQEVHDLFKKARENNDANYDKLVKNKAREALLELIKGGWYEEVHTIEKLDNDGNVLYKTEKKIRKYREPDTTAVIFALKNMDKENFADVTKIVSEYDTPERKRLREMSDEELLVEKNKLIDQLVDAKVAHKMREANRRPNQ